MMKPCEICGDVGFENIIRICSKCKNTHEHVYCMRVKYDGQPDAWVCEECETPTPKSLLKLVQTEQTEFTGTRASIKKPPQNTKTKYLTPTEAMGLEAGFVRNNYSSARKPSPSSSMGPPGFTKPLNSTTLRSTSTVQNLSTSKVKESSRYLQLIEPSLPLRKIPKSNLHAGPSSQRLPLLAGSPDVRTNHQSRNVDFGERKSAEVATQLEKRLSNHHVASPTTNVGSVEMASAEPPMKVDKHLLNHGSVSPTCNVDSGEMESAMKINICLPNHPSASTTCNVDSGGAESAIELDICLPNHPSASPTWKGRFKIASNIVPCGFIGGIQAHPPCTVHSRAYTLSKQMPELLKFELLRRSQRTNLFEDNAPCELDIGLYFLPSRGNDPSYASLVEYLDRNDILMKTQMHGVELLIFSSKHLEAKSQWLNHQHFLWGIFCSRLEVKIEGGN